MTETARCLDFVLHMWNCLNIKSSQFYIILNDQNRKPFLDFSDEMLTLLQDLARMFRQIDTFSPSTEVRNLGLASDTSDAVHISLMVFLSHP